MVLSDHQINLVDERFPKIPVINLSPCLDTDETNRLTTLKSFNVSLTSGGDHEALHSVAAGNKDTVTMSTLRAPPFGHILTPESLHSPVQAFNLTDCFHHYFTSTGDASYLLESRIMKSTLTGLQIIPYQSGSWNFKRSKRSCPGESMAMLEIILYTVTLVQKYNILPASEKEIIKLFMSGFSRNVCLELKLKYVPRTF